MSADRIKGLAIDAFAALRFTGGRDDHYYRKAMRCLEGILALSAAQADPVGLTDERIDAITVQQWGQGFVLSQLMAHRCYARAIEREVRTRSGEAVAGWQPIETAPKGSGEDGPNSTIHPDYVKPPRILLMTDEGPVIGAYEWYYHEGYGHGWEPGETAWRTPDDGAIYEPTHWMEVPAAPTPASMTMEAKT